MQFCECCVLRCCPRLSWWKNLKLIQRIWRQRRRSAAGSLYWSQLVVVESVKSELRKEKLQLSFKILDHSLEYGQKDVVIAFCTYCFNKYGGNRFSLTDSPSYSATHSYVGDLLTHPQPNTGCNTIEGFWLFFLPEISQDGIMTDLKLLARRYPSIATSGTLWCGMAEA